MKPNLKSAVLLGGAVVSVSLLHLLGGQTTLKLAKPERPAAGQGLTFKLQLQGGTNTVIYVLQSSTNLVSWETVVSGRVKAGAVIELSDVSPTNKAKFFRVREYGPDLVDTNPPSWTNGLHAQFSVIPPSGASVTWAAASDDVGVAQYSLYLNGVLVTNVPGSTLSYEFTLDLHRPADLRIQAADASGNVSMILSLVYLPGDDLLAISNENGWLYAFYVQTNGTFTAARQIADLNGGARGLGLGDFDHDGILDLIGGGASGNTLTPYLFKGTGDGTFATPVPLSTATGANSYMMDGTVGDFDGDGNLDFVCGGNAGYVFFYWGNGDGTFTLDVRSWGDGDGRGMVAGDFNEDGREDIARARCCDGQLKVYLSNGDRTFIETNVIASGVANNNPYAVAAGDFDEDGHLDLIAAGGANGDVTFFKGLGSGSFTNLGVNGLWANLNINNYASADAFDYNGDGHLDLAMVTYSSQAVYFWPGNGDGTFSTNRVTLGSSLGNILGISAPPRPPRVEVGISPLMPVINLNDSISYGATGVGVTSNDFFRWTFGDTGTNPLAWTFGPGTNNLGPTVVHTYTNEGRFVTRLWHTTTNGINSVRGTWATVKGAPPVSNPGGPYSFGELGATQAVWYATLDGSASTDDFGIVSYIWSLGDGTVVTNTGPTVFHGWPGPGVWPVTLTVVDAARQSSTNSTIVTFTPGAAPVAVINGPDVVDETAAHSGTWSATFYATNSTDDFGIWKYAWNFGNGQTASGAVGQTTYSGVGTYTVRLTVTDNANQTNTTTHSVTVQANDPPVPVINGPHLLTVDVATNGLWYGAWDALASTDDTGIYRYNWIFGDGATASGTQVTHSYAGQGVYPLKLTVTDNGNQSVTATQNVIVVAGNPPVARITASTLNPEGAQPISFSGASSSSDHGIYRYSWSLPPLRFDFAGQYLDPIQWRVANAVQDGKLMITGQNGWGSAYFFSLGLPVQRTGAFQGRVDTPSGDSHAMVGLKNLNSGSGQYGQLVYAIYFNNGEVRIYESGSDRGRATNYNVGTAYNFRIESKAGSGARYYLRPAGIGEPFAKIFETSNDTDGSFGFGADVYSGVFGFDELIVEGSFSSSRDFTTPVFPGGTVTLKVVDNALLTNTTSVVVAPVTGTPPVAVISGPTNGQAGVELAFNGYFSTDDHANASYTWDFGDGSPAVFGPAVTHSYGTPGTYTNTLTVLDYAGQVSTAWLVLEVAPGNLLVAVPWRIINGIEQPHEVYSGKTNTLKAVAGGVPVPFDYIWDYGDGSGTVTNTVTNTAVVYNLEARHAYTGSEGTPFYATIRLVQTNGTVLSDTYPLVLRPKTLDTEMKVAIDEGLWYLHKIQTRYDIDANHKGGYWTYSAWGSFHINVTASAAQAFGINGHLMTSDSTQDPYVETVQRGVNYLLTRLTTVNIGPQTYGDPDGNANGIGLSSPDDRPPYEVGPVMDALVAVGRPELVAAVGGANVKGRPFEDLMQDMVDVYAWGQSDYTDNRGGGWRYGWNGDSDNSVCQWAAIGFMAAERYWGMPAPGWVKERNLVWVAYSAGGSGFGYAGPGDGEATTPSAMVQLAWIGVPTTNSLWIHGENYLANQWNWLMGPSINNVYANYAVAKALRSANPPVENFSLSGKDWFRDPNNGLARVTIDRQRKDGSWIGGGRGYDGDPQLATAWSVIILSSSIFQQGPVAVISVAPNPSAIGYPVVFDARGSYHQHPAYKVVEYRWDFNAANGVDFDHPDAIGPVVTNTYGMLGTNTVSLQVRDNGSPQLSDVASVVVRTTMPPYPPTADAGGPYVACVGQDIHLDASGSFCVDAAAGNFIQSYDWEVDFEMPLDFNDGVTGMRVVLTNGFATSGQHRVGLRVRNANSIVYTNVALPDMTADAFAMAYVYDRVIADLRGRPKGNKCQLTWTKAGDYGVVMRSRLGPDRGFEEIGRTDSSYATFLDTNIEYNVEYYYRVYAYASGRPEPFGVSDAEFVVSFPRNFDERPPHFESTPLRVAQVGQLYSVTLDVKNPVNEVLYFSMLAGPVNLTVNLTNGNVRYVPTPDQVGSQPVSFQVTNAYGRDVLSYTIFVFPATNHAPVARANGPYSGLTGESIQFSSAGSGDPDDNPLRFFWNFGDGTLSTNPNPTHVYGGIGDYLVTLFVNDGYGGTASSQTHAAITRPNRPPVAVLAHGPHFAVRLGETLALDASASYDLDGDPVTFTWLWGDGAASNNAAATASHRYAATGLYSGSVIVADNRGGAGTNNFDVTVAASNRPPAIVLTVSTNEPFVMSDLALDASATTDPENDPMTFEWDFGDRTRTTGPLVSHMYRQMGDFTVTLKVSDNHGGVSLATRAIHVLNAPPVFTSHPPLLARAGTNYTYTPTLSDVDGDTSTFQLIQGPLAMLCDTNTGRLTWLPGTNDLGPNSVVLRATDTNGGSTDQSFTLVVTTPLGPQLDLAPTHIAMTNVVVDSQTLALSGTAKVYLRNSGTDTVPVPFTVSVFVDADFDGAYSTNADRLVGWGNFPAGLLSGQSGWIEMTVNGQSLFKDCPLYAFVDSENVVPEYDESNNIRRSGFDLATNQPPVIDLSAAALQVDRIALPAKATLTARLGNCGLVSVPTNVPMAFYDGNPKAGGALIGVARSTLSLVPGRYQDLSVAWNGPAITNHTVYVVADDNGQGTNLFPEITLSNNTFSVVVDLAAILPPVAGAGPDQTVVLGDTVVLNGRSSHDPQGRSLTYQWSIVSIPIGSQAHLTGTNTVSPSFQADVAGPYAVRLVVNNGLLDSTNSSTVRITAVDTNAVYPPAITSIPSFQGMVSVLYTYQVVATDPQSKPLTFRLPQAPAGMTINTNTGLVRWTPTNAGNFLVQAAADGVGGSAFQGYSLTIVPYTNLPPQFTSTPVLTALPNALYTYTAAAVDPNLDTVTYSLTQKPSGMAINATSGLVTWTPTTSQMGGNTVTVTASDGHGGTATQTFNLVVMNPGVTVLPIPDQTVTAPNTFATISLDNYVRDPNYSASQIVWAVTGTNLLRVTIDSNRVAAITYAAGVLTSERLTFLATDPDGKSGYSAPLLTVRAVDNPPVAALANLSANETTSINTGLFELKGTADDPDAVDSVAYRIALYDANGAQVADVTPKPVNLAGWHEGRVAAGGSLGRLDFTMLENGAYTLLLAVRGGALTATATADVALNSSLKIGRMTFSQQDLMIPVSGIPFALTRTYDSLGRGSGDFGYSWTYETADLNVEVNEIRAQTQDLFGDTFSLRTGGGWDVTLEMPTTGQRVTFVCSIQAGGMLRGQAVWTPPPGINATLVPTCSPNIIKLWGLPPYWEAAGIDTALDNFDFPGFILTTRDGTQYRIARQDLGEHYIDANGASYGNTVHAYGEAYLQHVLKPDGRDIQMVRSGTQLQAIDVTDSGTNTLRALYFDRDAQGRIVAAYTRDRLDASGRPAGLPAATYEYDASGNLVKANRLADASDVSHPVYYSTSYIYGNPRFPHYITEIEDPRGIAPIRCEYDANGRLIATIDPYGRRTEVRYDLDARTSTVFDRMGNPTIQLFDTRGNIVAATDPLGRTTTCEYDANNRLLLVRDPLGHVSRCMYDAAGNVVSAVDPLGHTNTFTYDGQGNATTMTDPLGRSQTMVYSQDNQLLRLTTPSGATTEFHYNSQGNLTEIVDPLGNVPEQMTYDASGNIARVTRPTGLTMINTRDALGNRTSQQYQWQNPADSNDVQVLTMNLSYDATGQMTGGSGPFGVKFSQTYDPLGNPVNGTDRFGGTTVNTYDLAGLLIQAQFPDGGITQCVYDENGRTIVAVDRHRPGQSADGTHQVFDAAGQLILSERMSNVVVEVTTTTNAGVIASTSRFVSSGGVISSQATVYDDAGRVVSETDELGQTTEYEYDDAGSLTATVDPAGQRTEFEYDAAGRQTLTRNPQGRETLFGYDADDRRCLLVDPDGGVEKWEYDAAGHLSRHTDKSGRVTSYDYDLDGRLVRTAGPQGVSTVEYDGAGRVTRTMDEAGRETRNSYDIMGRLVSRTDAGGHTTLFDYDGLGNITRATDAAGNTNLFTYDSGGRLTSMTDALGRHSSFAYDGAGRMVRRTWPLGMSQSYTYDAQGRLASFTDCNGRTTTYEYEGNEARLAGKRFGDGTSVRYTYNPDGFLASVTDSHGVTRCVRDSRNRVTGVQRPDGIALGYTYDDLDHVTSVTGPHGTMRYDYNADGILMSVTDADGQKTEFQLDGAGAITQAQFASGARCVYSYGTNDMFSRIEYFDPAGHKLASLAYGFDELGRRASEVDETGRLVEWRYDNLGRLVRESVTESNGTPDVVTYEYDAVGNCVNRTDRAGATRYTYDANDRMLTAGTDTFSWDNNGNLLGHVSGEGTETYDYDLSGRLAQFTSAGGLSTAYDYDYAGNRIRKTNQTGDTHYVVDEINPTGLPQVLLERTAGGAVAASYAYGPWLLSEKHGANKLWTILDGRHGSVRRTALPTGALAGRLNYGAFGLPQQAGSPSGLAHGFAGQITDPETGFVYLRARYHDPRVGRFFTPDPLLPSAGDPSTLNAYLYAANDPINASDPTGLETLVEMQVAMSIRNIIINTEINIGLDFFNFAMTFQKSYNFNEAMDEYRVNQNLGMVMLFVPGGLKCGAAILKGSLSRSALVRANAFAMWVHKNLMRSLGFTGHDWSKNWLWCWFNSTKGRDVITDLSIRYHNLVEPGHHLGSTWQQLREKCFDIVLAGCEKARTPLMSKPRVAPAELQKEWQALNDAGKAKHWMVNEALKNFKAPPGVSSDALRRTAINRVDEAIKAALKYTDELTAVNPYSAMPGWFIQADKRLEQFRTVINDVGAGEMIHAMQLYLGINLAHKGVAPTQQGGGTPPAAP